MLRRTTASPRPASGAGVRSMRARPAPPPPRPRSPAAKWPSASSAGASNTARCARPNIEASQPSLPTSCSISSATISCAFPSSSPPEAESARKPENRFRQTEIQQQRTKTAWLPQVFQQTARALRLEFYDLLLLLAQPVDAEADDVAGFQEFRLGLDAHADTGRRAGDDHIAGLQYEELRAVPDQM